MATFGNTSVGAVEDSGGGFLVGNPFAITENGTVTQISVYMDLVGLAASNVVCGIYAQTGGLPGARVGYTSPVTVGAGAAAAWVNFNVTSGGVLTTGTYYLCYVPSTADRIHVYGAASAVQEVFNNTGYSSPPPDPYGTAGTDVGTFSIYATYTPSGAAAPVADFVGAPLSIASGGTVVFTDLSTGSPTSWSWEKSSDGVNYVPFSSGGSHSQNPTEAFT